jgi:putative ABC transport system permease protein
MWSDFRYSVRALRATPVFAATAIITVALTIGPTTSMLNVGEWLLWRPVPAVPDTSRLGVVWFGEWGPGRVSPWSVSPLNIADMVGSSRTIAAMAGVQETQDAVTVEGRPAERVGVSHADASLFDTLGIRPSAGRFFTPPEDKLPSGAQVALVSDRLARRAFGSPEGALGKTILLNGERFAIIGVAPAGFRGIEPFSDVDVWYPGAAYRQVHHFRSAPAVGRSHGTFYSFVIRLRPGASFAQAEAELNSRAQGLLERYPEENGFLTTARARVFAGLGAHPLQRREYASMIQRLLFIAAVLVGLGCVNLANLLIFRGVRRDREHAVRMALGAGRAGLLRLHVVESCLLTLAGAAAGLGAAEMLNRFVVALVLPSVAASNLGLKLPLDWRVLSATLLLSVACGVFGGWLSGWISTSRSVALGLAQAGGHGTPRGRWVRSGFAAAQLALSLALVVGALLMVTTLRGLRGVHPGFAAGGVTVYSIDLSSQGYTPRRALQYVRDLETGLSSNPALSAVSVSYSWPLGAAFIQPLQIPGTSTTIDLSTNFVSGDYFNVVGIPLLHGRSFTREEALDGGAASSRSVIIGESLARRLFGASDPIGRSLALKETRRPPEQPRTVVGVVGDVVADLLKGEPELALYEPFAASPFATRPVVLIRSRLTARAVSKTVGALAARIDPATPVSLNQPLAALTIERRLSTRRVFAWVLSIFGALGLALASVGLFGLLSQAVIERTREFGIRMAIGATRRQIYGLVLRSAGTVAVMGTLTGLLLATFGSRLLEAQLWGITARSPVIYAAGALMLSCVVFVAAAWPARAATRIEPIEALRME